MIKKMPQPNCLYTTRYCWEAEKVKTLIRLRAELSPLFTGKRNASKYAWAVVERELNVPLPLSKIIKKWNNLLQEYKAIKLSEEPKRREWPFFNLMDVYFSDQVNDPTLRLFSSTKTLGADSLDDSITLKFEEDPAMSAAIAAATGHSLMDISDMMKQDRESDQASERDYEDMHPDVQMNNNNYNNGGERRTSPAHQTHAMNKSINSANSASTGNGTRVGTPIGMQPQNDYDDQDDVKPPMAHTPVYMPQHHNIDQYLLSWNNFHGNMCKGFHNLQKDEKMVDVTIAAGGKIFKAHKLVLSVCSPYFQKIFLDHPSSHPILFMTDVNSNHMAGLLDFMYSGQVNVKYEDLPKFLKVAEIMQIKGLHTESTTETEESKYGRNAMKEPVNYNNKQPNMNNNNNSSNNNLNIPSPTQNRSTFREHIRAKNPYQDLINSSSNNNNNNSSTNNNLTNNNSSLNNNNSSSNNNNNSNSTNQNLSPKYAIQQTNSSSKILDNQKYHKYFSKRKMMAQYELEMRNEKRNKLSLPTPPAAHQPQDEPVALYNKSLPPPQTEPEELTVNETNNNSSTTANNNTINSTNNSISSSDVQNIKVEPDLVQRSGSGVIATVATTAVNDDHDDDDDDSQEYFLADLRKRKHSTSGIEQTLALTTKKEASTACS